MQFGPQVHRLDAVPSAMAVKTGGLSGVERVTKWGLLS